MWLPTSFVIVTLNSLHWGRHSLPVLWAGRTFTVTGSYGWSTNGGTSLSSAGLTALCPFFSASGVLKLTTLRFGQLAYILYKYGSSSFKINKKTQHQVAEKVKAVTVKKCRIKQKTPQDFWVTSHDMKRTAILLQTAPPSQKRTNENVSASIAPPLTFSRKANTFQQ